ncbi:HEPN domain-containing protein [Sulfobacillus thermotolerans]|uniref:ApeA N-terminal domain 1-containing protein n=1 Tax=Sulfobacillus thermotolerans TaxID=338644 RepID=UPI0033663198
MENKAREKSLTADFDLSGLWWDPENPSVKWFGTVEFRHNTFTTITLWADQTLFQKASHLYGLTQNGEAVTLIDLKNTGGSISSGQKGAIHAASFITKYMVVGAYVTLETLYRHMAVEYTYIEYWVWQPTEVANPGTVSDVDCGYIRSLRATMALSPTHRTFKNLTSHINTVGWSFHITFDKGETLDTLLSMSFDLGNFLTVLFGQATYVQTVELKHDTKTTDSVKVFYSTLPKRLLDKIHRDHFVVPFSVFQSTASLIVPQWFDNLDTYRPVIGLYTATIFGVTQFSEFSFLALIQGIESYHRRRFPARQYMAPDDYRTAIAEWVSQIPSFISNSSHRQSLKNKVTFGYEYSLRKRLKELLGVISPGEKAAIVSNYDEQPFIQKIVDTRNYLTHYTEELAILTAQGSELPIATPAGCGALSIASFHGRIPTQFGPGSRH